MRTLPQHTAPVGAVCVSDHRIKVPVAVCVGMVHRSSKGTQIAQRIFQVNISNIREVFTPLVAYLCCLIPMYIYPRQTKYAWYIEDIQMFC